MCEEKEENDGEYFLRAQQEMEEKLLEMEMKKSNVDFNSRY